MPVLFVDVPKVEIEIRHQSLTGIGYDFNVLDDCGTGNDKRRQSPLTKTLKASLTKELSCPSQLDGEGAVSWRQAGSGRAHVFRGSREATRYPLISIRCNCYPEKTSLPFPHDGHYMLCYDS